LPEDSEPLEINLRDVVAEVRAVFEAYEAALRRNDARALNGFFWDSPLALRYGIAEHNRGIAAIRRWRNTAPGVAASRRLRATQIVTFGTHTASVCTEFVSDDTASIGRQTQTWVKFGARWAIVAAHVSLVATLHDAQ
jgi:ketosteroid isomerase-like protein